MRKGIAITFVLSAVGCAGRGEPARPDPAATADASVRRAVQLYEEARTAMSRNDEAQAMSLLTDAITAAPRFPQARAARAAIYDRRNESAAAEADLAQAISDGGPDAALYYFVRARYYHRRRQFEAAESDYTTAVLLERQRPDPYQLDILTHRALLYLDTNRADAAVRDYEAALRLNPDPQTRAEIQEWIQRARRPPSR